MTTDDKGNVNIPGDLDPYGPQRAWDEIEMGNDRIAADIFEAWLNKFLNSEYMSDPAFRLVVSSAMCDLAVCLSTVDRDKNLSKCVYLYLDATFHNPNIINDCRQGAHSALDRILMLKSTKLIPLRLDDFNSVPFQNLLDGWYNFKQKEYEKAITSYEKVLADYNSPEAMQGVTLSYYAASRLGCNEEIIRKAVMYLRLMLNKYKDVPIDIFSAPYCATEKVFFDKKADLAFLRSDIRRYKVIELNTRISPKVDVDKLNMLKNFDKIEFEFPKVVSTIQFFSMGVVKQSKHGGEDYIELVGSLFPSERPNVGDKHIGKIFIHAYGNLNNPTYKVIWCLIDYIDDEYFIYTDQNGKRFRNRITPMKDISWGEILYGS